MDALKHNYFAGSNYPDIHRTCPFANELTDDEVLRFVNSHCGGV